MLEFEKKILLTEREYCILLNQITSPDSVIKQTNYYYDNDTLDMNLKGITCRIRHKEDKYTLMIKSHKHGDDYCSFEKNIAVLDHFDDTKFENMGLSLKGKLVTYRQLFYKDKNIEIVLDKNEYFNVVDYELEIEYPNECEALVDNHITKIANILGIKQETIFKRMVSAETKSNRLFKKLTKI